MTSWTTFKICSGAASKALIGFIYAGRAWGAPQVLNAHTSVIAEMSHDLNPGGHLDIIGRNGVDRIILIKLGDEVPHGGWHDAGGHVVAAMRALNIASGRLPTSENMGADCDYSALIEGVLLHSFRHDQSRSQPRTDQVEAEVVIADDDRIHLEQAIMQTTPVNRARAWVEQPANLLTPATFAEEAASALLGQGVGVRILDLAALVDLGAGGLLAVSSGSANEPRLVVAEWRGDPHRAGWDVALVGKGVTFDAGGLNLKARPAISKMKLDMAGAAAVIGALELIAARRVKRNVVVVVPMTENTIDGKAYRPGDVITSLSGLTIEVQDTDAEGRIILADGISYAIDHYDPSYVVDIATLTGAMFSILQEDYAGLFTADDALATSLLTAGTDSGEPLWRLPLEARQDYLVESSVADVSNLAVPGLFGMSAGSAAGGAKFLERFVKGRSWAHLDMAGVAWLSRRTGRVGPGASGFGVALLNRWIDLLEIKDA